MLRETLMSIFKNTMLVRMSIAIFPSRKEFGEIIQRLPNWKAAGCDRVFNFFIKQLSGLHDHLYRLVKEVCMEGRKEDEVVLQRTYNSYTERSTNLLVVNFDPSHVCPLFTS